MTADFKALCEELCDLLDQIDLSIFRRAGIFREVQTRARAALEAPPAPVVGDDDLRGVFYDHCDYDDDASWIESEQFIVAVRAVLAKCGTTPAPVPVPVTERLPGQEDRNKNGECWWFNRAGVAEWQLSSGGPYGDFWLPAHALPLPEVTP